MNAEIPPTWTFTVSESDPKWGIITDGCGNIVANVNSETGPDLPPLAARKMPMAANGHLIAAAPDLLEACEYTLATLEDTEMDCDEDGEEYSDVTKLRAAIAKARGQA